MKIGLIVAIEGELLAMLDSNSFKYEETIENCFKVIKSIINSNEVYIVKSGCGEIDASSATQFLITKYSVDLILNFGIVGALKRDLKVSDLFLVKKVVHYDYDTSKIDGTKVAQYLEFNDVYMETKGELYKKIYGIMPSIKNVICASGDKFIEDKVVKERLANLYDASICDMESAAIVRICFKNNIEAIIIKCISDTFDGDAEEYMTNIKNSSKKAFSLIQTFLESL